MDSEKTKLGCNGDKKQNQSHRMPLYERNNVAQRHEFEK